MTRTTAIWGSILFFAIGPVTAAGIVPWWISRWDAGPAFLGIGPSRVLGGALIAAGLPVLIEAYARFAVACRARGYPAFKLHTWQPPLSGAPSSGPFMEKCPTTAAASALVARDASWSGAFGP